MFPHMVVVLVGTIRRRFPTLPLVLLALAAGTAPASAELASAQCYLKVDGRVLIDRICKAYFSKRDGSFQIGAEAAQPISYFADVNAASGEAFWNAAPGATRATSPLGKVTRDGECWQNDRAQLCARRLEGKPVSKTPAVASPQDRMVPARPVMVGGAASLDACAMSGVVAGLGPVRPSDPKSGYLSVRSGPGGAPYGEVSRLSNGEPVIICEQSGNWYGVLLNEDPRSCGVSTPIAARQPYQGPCRWGWVHRSYVRQTAG